MNQELSAFIAQAQQWLAQQDTPEPGSPRWYAIGNFRSFVSAVTADPSADSIATAVHSLRHFISDQYEWNARYCRDISAQCEQAASIGKRLARG
jgi:hypothetical protein